MDAQVPAEVVETLKRIVSFELAGVVRFTHYALMVTGPNRIPLVAFLQEQANESLVHAQKAGEILTGLGGHPSMAIPAIAETGKHSISDILEESFSHELKAIELYKQLLALTREQSIYLEEYARSQIAAEEVHVMELRKMLRDYS
jgi:bacterioferritin